MKTTSSRHLSLVLALCAGLALLGASCKEDSVSIQATSTPKVAAPTTTPEQAWDMYVQGWKHENLDEILKACAPNKEAQNRCREQFNVVQASGHMQNLAKELEKGKIIFEKDLEEIRFYTLAIDDTGTSVTFRFSKELGWRIDEF